MNSNSMGNPMNPNSNKNQNDTRQKIASFRNKLRRDQHRNRIDTIRSKNIQNPNLQLEFKKEMSHLENNALKDKLLPKLHQWSNEPIDINNLGTYLADINSNDIMLQHRGIMGIRRILCEHKDVPIQAIIDQNAVPKIIEFTQRDNQRHLQLEATWTLANLASGTTEQTRSLIQKKVIEVFIAISQSEYSQIVEQAVWGLGNISGDCLEFRNLILKSNAPRILLNTYTKFTQNPTIISHITWVFSNLCRIRHEKEPFSSSLRDIVANLIQTFTYHSNSAILDDCLMGICKYVKQQYIPLFTDDNFILKLRQFYSMLLADFAGNILKISAVHAIVGGITSSEDAYTDKVIKAGFLADITKVISINNETLLREICWITSNIAIGTEEQINALLSEQGMLDKLFQLSFSDNTELSKEAVWSVCNLTKTKLDANITLLFEKGVLNLFKHFLSEEFEIRRIILVMEGLIQLMSYFESKGPNEKANFMDLLVKEGIGEQIEALQAHSADLVYLKALFILETHFVLEEEELY